MIQRRHVVFLLVMLCLGLCARADTVTITGGPIAISGGFTYQLTYSATGCPCGDASIATAQIQLGSVSPGSWVNVSPSATISGEFGNGSYFGGVTRTYTGDYSTFTQFRVRVRDSGGFVYATSAWVNLPEPDSNPYDGWDMQITGPSSPFDCDGGSSGWVFDATEISPPAGVGEPGFEYPQVGVSGSGPQWSYSQTDWNGAPIALPLPTYAGNYSFTLQYLDTTGEIPTWVPLDTAVVVVECENADPSVWIEMGECEEGEGMVGGKIAWAGLGACAGLGGQFHLYGTGGPQAQGFLLSQSWTSSNLSKWPAGSITLSALLPGSYSGHLCWQPGGGSQHHSPGQCTGGSPLGWSFSIAEECDDETGSDPDPDDPNGGGPGVPDADNDGDVWDQSEIDALIAATSGTEEGVEALLAELEAQGTSLDQLVTLAGEQSGKLDQVVAALGVVQSGLAGVQGGLQDVESAVEGLQAALEADTLPGPEGNLPDDGASTAAELAALIPEDVGFADVGVAAPLELELPLPASSPGGEWGSTSFEIQLDPRGWSPTDPVLSAVDTVRGIVRSLLVVVLTLAFIGRILRVLREY